MTADGCKTGEADGTAAEGGIATEAGAETSGWGGDETTTAGVPEGAMGAGATGTADDGALTEAGASADRAGAAEDCAGVVADAS